MAYAHGGNPCLPQPSAGIVGRRNHGVGHKHIGRVFRHSFENPAIFLLIILRFLFRSGLAANPRLREQTDRRKYFVSRRREAKTPRPDPMTAEIGKKTTEPSFVPAAEFGVLSR